MITQTDIDAFADGRPRFATVEKIAPAQEPALSQMALNQAYRTWMEMSMAMWRMLLPVWLRPR